MGDSRTAVRYRIAPWLREYDALGDVWRPYVMSFHRAGYASGAVNTDSRGFRRSTRGGDRLENFSPPDPERDVGLVVGGSVAFGVGAETDAGTIPSILNETSELAWLNFGGKAISSTQELLLFLFHHHDVGRLRRVVFFSGLNELLMPLLGIRPEEAYGPFFHLQAFDRRMNARRVRGWRRLAEAFRGRAPQPPVRTDPDLDPDALAEGAVAVYRRNLLAWQRLCAPLGVEPAFVLQPVVAWLERAPSPEEAELFAELDAHPTNLWRTVQAHFTSARHAWYAERLAAACAEAGVSFHDANPAFGADDLDGAWLFVDRVHMTDRGHRVAPDRLRAWGLA